MRDHIYQDAIPSWIDRARERDAKYIMVYLDTFDYMYYPVFVSNKKALLERRALSQDVFIEIIEL